VVWRDRLYLFWVTFRDRPNDNPELGTTTGTKTITEASLADLMSDVKAAGTQKQLDAQLHWSEYLRGEWSTRKSGGFIPLAQFVVFVPSLLGGIRIEEKVATVPLNFDPRSLLIYVSKEYDEKGEERGVFIHLYESIFMNLSFYLAGRNSEPVKAANRPAPANPYNAETVHATRYSGSGALKVTFTRTLVTEESQGSAAIVKTPSILQQGSEYTLLQCDNDITLGSPEIASLAKPVFYQDNTHTLFVEPNVTEETTETWENWVPPLPLPNFDWNNPVWWENIDVLSHVPNFGNLDPIDPDDPVWRIDVSPESLIHPKLDQDWLLNSGTGLLFDGELIASGGRTGLTVAPSGDALAGGGIVNANSGSDIAPGASLVVSETGALAQAGLTNLAGGLNVIGAGGFNSALAQSFDALAKNTGTLRIGG